MNTEPTQSETPLTDAHYAKVLDDLENDGFFKRDILFARGLELKNQRWKACCALLAATFRAHEVETLDCDRRGELHCDCLEKALRQFDKLNQNA